ncbi:succinate:quinone oxidoreductase, FAD binding protein (fragment) [Gammaproteobacteria bacterium]
MREGRGCGPQADHVWLHIAHLGETLISKRLPGVRDMARTFLGIDPIFKPIPVFPTAHYVMGGIPTDRFGRVVVPRRKGAEEVVPGLYAAGECACVSVHGANRLGGNSLLDILVFGRSAGDDILQYLKDNPHPRPLDETSLDRAESRLARWEQTGQGESVAMVRERLRKVMEDHCGVFREASVMREGIARLHVLRGQLGEVRLRDQGRIFNTARLEALELGNLMDIAMATLSAALAREESRGAHSRIDYPARDDVRWLKHSLYFLEGDRLEWKPVRTKPLTVDSFAPRERVY